MSSFLSGLMSVGKKIGGAAENWAKGTKVGKDITNARQSTMNPWYSAKKQPGSKNEGDAPQSNSSGSQDA